MAARRTICIEIGQFKTRAVEISRGIRTEVTHAVEFPTNNDYYNDGYIVDIEGCASYIKENLAQAGIDNGQIIFLLVSSKIMTRETSIPIVKKRQLASVIQDAAEDSFPMGLESHSIAYVIQKTRKEDKQQEILLYAVPEDLVSQYYQLGQAMGMKVRSIDCASNAVFRWANHDMSGSSSMIVQVGISSTLTTIVSDNMMKLQRRINYGLEDLLQTAVDNGLASELFEANELMRRKRLLAAELPESQIPPEDDEKRIEFEITESARQLVSNISRLLEYFYQNNKGSVLDNILLIGAGSEIKGLAKLIENELDISVLIADEAADNGILRSLRKVTGGRTGLFLTVAASSIQPLNLMTSDIKAGEERRGDLLVYVKICMAVILVCSVLLASAGLRCINADRENARLIEERQAIAYINEMNTEYLYAQGAEKEIAEMAASISRENEGLEYLFESFEKLLPSTAVISALSAGDSTLNMTVIVDSKETAARMLTTLKQVEGIEEVYISGLTDTVNEVTGARQVQFTLTCRYSYVIPQVNQEAKNE